MLCLGIIIITKVEVLPGSESAPLIFNFLSILKQIGPVVLQSITIDVVVQLRVLRNCLKLKLVEIGNHHDYKDAEGYCELVSFLLFL